MTRDQKSPADRKTRRAELDRSALADSSFRSAVTDLSPDLDLVVGEAALVFAYLRDALAELVNSPAPDGDLNR